ncbi:uncharacterized protein LOC111617528 [Centruroides sculpturatus]|uniref:uncharacterized protein LOC111617528 n=1 Tax=Centruroides sculpturatus TaxID=218467 RepID=UPI000C6D0DAA|nr:uncharacterized protein LOC111617528 [Centruroides sculpturatus]
MAFTAHNRYRRWTRRTGYRPRRLLIKRVINRRKMRFRKIKRRRRALYRRLKKNQEYHLVLFKKVYNISLEGVRNSKDAAMRHDLRLNHLGPHDDPKWSNVVDRYKFGKPIKMLRKYKVTSQIQSQLVQQGTEGKWEIIKEGMWKAIVPHTTPVVKIYNDACDKHQKLSYGDLQELPQVKHLKENKPARFWHKFRIPYVDIRKFAGQSNTGWNDWINQKIDINEAKDAQTFTDPSRRFGSIYFAQLETKFNLGDKICYTNTVTNIEVTYYSWWIFKGLLDL